MPHAVATGCATGALTGAGVWAFCGGTASPALFLLVGLLSFCCALIVYRVIRQEIRLIDEATNRLKAAAEGDFQTPIAPALHAARPDLAAAMESLFRQTHATLDHIESLAHYDMVTGLASRSSFCAQVEALLDGQERAGPAVMLFIDLDRFKAVNDTMGHAAGDHILRQVAERLRQVVTVQFPGATDAIIGRYAGDEFTIFLPHIPPESSALWIARAVHYALDEAFDIAGTQVSIGASIGVAYYPEHGATLAMLLRSADQAMYDAKHNGRGQVRLYSEDLALRIAGRAELERDLRLALERDEFFLEFQPQVDLSVERVTCAEALVRWTHPLRGRVMPDKFVGLAEETGLIVDLGDWILNHVCQTAARWAMAGVDQRLSINISRRELAQPDFFLRLEQAMERHGTPSEMLELELSETLMMKLRNETSAALVNLRARGVSIAIDDFGTGFSNLAQLRDLPIDRVKIDRSLVRDIAVSVEARTICSAIVGLVSGLGLEIVVEGIENEQQIDLLRVMGCTVFQGFHLCRPVPEMVYLERFSDLGTAAARA